MAISLAFDIYGTLIDTSGVVTALQAHMGTHAQAFSRRWRAKQLEYSFRRGLMSKYRDFSVCTRDALDYACQAFGQDLSDDDKDGLMAVYRVLPPFPDVETGLQELHASAYRMFAFSNGRAQDVAGLLKHANIEKYFTDVISVDEVKSFKPDPAVYAHFLKRSGSTGAESWLISSNPFDVIGAVSAGMQAAWLRRTDDMIFDPWEIKPTITITSIADLKGALG